jgi:hypothetical protein
MKYVLLFFVLFCASCSEQGNWTAFVYPDIENIPSADNAQNYTIGNFKSFEECQNASDKRMKYNYQQTGQQGDYSCGLDCTRREKFDGLLVCTDTRK